MIAVSVTAKMEKQFADITLERPRSPRTKPTVVQTILRSQLVQDYSLNAVGVQPANVVIEPDVKIKQMGKKDRRPGRSHRTMEPHGR